MKLLLVQPAGNYIIKTNGEQGAKLCVQPLGLLYIASFLRKNIPDIEIKVLDCQVEDFNNEKHIRSFRSHKIIRYGLSEENIQKRIENYEPDAVAISCLQCTRMYEAHEIAKITKKVEKILNKNIITIMGGQYATSLYNIAIQDKNLDYCILGEGEYPLYYLLHNMTNKNNND